MLNVLACRGGAFILCICEPRLESREHEVANVSKRGICHLPVASGVHRRDESRTGHVFSPCPTGAANSFSVFPGSGRNGYTKAVDGKGGGGEGEEEEEEGGEGDGGGGGQGRGGGEGEGEEEWDEELDGGDEDGVKMTRTDTLHSTTSSTGTQRRRGQHAKKQVRRHANAG